MNINHIDVCVKPWTTRVTYPDGHTVTIPPSQWADIVRTYGVTSKTHSDEVADAWYYEALMGLRRVANG